MATGGTVFIPFDNMAEAYGDEPAPIASIPEDTVAAFCDAGARAPAGWKRYRIRGVSAAGSHPVRYCLAQKQADAEKLYRVAEAEVDKLVVTAMPD